MEVIQSHTRFLYEYHHVIVAAFDDIICNAEHHDSLLLFSVRRFYHFLCMGIKCPCAGQIGLSFHASSKNGVRWQDKNVSKRPAKKVKFLTPSQLWIILSARACWFAR